MITKDRLAEVGVFQKTHALKGELNALLDIEPDFFTDGYPLVIDVDGVFVPFYVESARGKGASSCLIKLEDINTSDEANAFVNASIYARKEDLEEYFGDEDGVLAFEDDLVGYTVIDAETGEIGVIYRVDDATVNVLLVVRNQSGEDVYIPAVDEFIENIDPEAKTIYVNLPEGLVGLNAAADDDEE